MSIKTYNCTALTGGAARALDAISVAVLANGDRAQVLSGGKIYFFVFNSASTAAESSPGTIRPNDYATAGVWENLGSPFGDIGPTITSTVPIYGDIRGGDITKTGATTLTITPCSCRDSTGLIALYTGVSKTITAPTGSAWAANTLYHIFMVRLVADGSCEFRAYLTEAAAAADVAQVNAYRWIDFWNTNGSTQLVAAKTIAGEKYIDAYNGLTTHSSIASASYIDITLSVLPVGRFSAWLPSIAAATGDNTTQPRGLSITHDGTNMHCSANGYGGTVGQQMWMVGNSPDVWTWLPPTGCQVKVTGQTWSLGIAGVKLRR